MVRPRSALDLDIDACRQVELHESVERLGGRLQNVDEALVGAHLELLPRLLVDVRATQHRVATDGRGQGDGASHARACAACRLDDVRRRLVEELVIERLQANSDFGRVSHGYSQERRGRRGSASLGRNHSMISETTPAPTVRPPSRMANRICDSSATGVISSTSTVTLSPGITIFTPSGNCTEPVTSVVRM